MKNLKTYEGFFDFFKRKESEDDKIALEYITRLKRVTDISPYDIVKNDDTRGSHSIFKYDVIFDDTEIKVAKVESHLSRGFPQEQQNFLIERGLIRMSNKIFYALRVNCVGEIEKVYPRASILRDLYDLCDSVYKKDKEARRIRNINININPAADKLNPDI